MAWETGARTRGRSHPGRPHADREVEKAAIASAWTHQAQAHGAVRLWTGMLTAQRPVRPARQVSWEVWALACSMTAAECGLLMGGGHRGRGRQDEYPVAEQIVDQVAPTVMHCA
ncbi:hypothetical protein [Streptomyces sp. NPDC088746]|uniref:hypothetical protein n=1 Tax=Streptomyces sp. NPDC088746 TaxID=3365885 RepID=UPI00380EFF21